MGGKRRKLQQRQTPSARTLKAQGGVKLAKPQQKAPQQSQKQKQKSKQQQERQLQHQRDHPTIPFDAQDPILLIGEGDLSFAASIIRHYGCTNVTATVLEKNRAELLDKYPHAEDNIAVIAEPHVAVPRAKKKQRAKEVVDYGSDVSDIEPDYPEEDSDDDEEDENADGAAKPILRPASNKLLYNIDATKPPTSLTRSPAAYTRILFNFPHVGGKSTDVNRQVRYNQELLVSFFQRVLPALQPGGTIVVTLFEGEPYTLWNVRDLARHAGLQVDRSFRFQSAAYPGYKHARTLGVVKSKKGEVGGGWKGEQRSARSYVFVRKGDDVRQPSGMVPSVGVKKRKRSGSDDESNGEE